eukprot:15276472-Ditylum_brightwellii.AAC.1
MFVNNKVNKMFKEHVNNMHIMSNFENVLISSTDKSVQRIMSITSVEASNNEDCKLVAKK